MIEKMRKLCKNNVKKIAEKIGQKILEFFFSKNCEKNWAKNCAIPRFFSTIFCTIFEHFFQIFLSIWYLKNFPTKIFFWSDLVICRTVTREYFHREMTNHEAKSLTGRHSTWQTNDFQVLSNFSHVWRDGIL